MRRVAIKDPYLGKVIGGRFLVKERLGSGGVADVYKAEQLTLGKRQVAIRFLKKVIVQSSTPEAQLHRRRFLWEAQLLSTIRGPYFPAVIDAGKLQGDPPIPYIVMEYLRGPDLNQFMNEWGKLPLPTALRITFMLAEALLELHNHGVIYKDLSPGNVILMEDKSWKQVPVLFDFSHVSVTGLDVDGLKGEEGLLAGTPLYSAPELIRGQITQAADVFSLAALFYFMSTGKPIINLATVDWDNYVQKVALLDNLPEVPMRKLTKHVPKTIDEVMQKALNKRVEDRFQTVKEFVYKLTRAILAKRSIMKELAKEEWNVCFLGKVLST